MILQTGRFSSYSERINRFNREKQEINSGVNLTEEFRHAEGKLNIFQQNKMKL